MRHTCIKAFPQVLTGLARSSGVGFGIGLIDTLWHR
jgi:hypothetical protein